MLLYPGDEIVKVTGLFDWFNKHIRPMQALEDLLLDTSQIPWNTAAVVDGELDNHVPLIEMGTYPIWATTNHERLAPELFTFGIYGRSAGGILGRLQTTGRGQLRESHERVEMKALQG